MKNAIIPTKENEDVKIYPGDTKQVFRECGTCSRTFAHILNREFGHQMDLEEKAIDPLAGGISNQGHQCGMLWGATLATGAEAFRRNENLDEAIVAAVRATQHLVQSFTNRTSTVNCREIIDTDLSSPLGLFKFGLKTTLQGIDNNDCFNLAEKWAPEAIQSAEKGLEGDQGELTHTPVSCASEVAKKMGATEEEMAMVAGFAGGLGLSGNACGALSAAIWMKSLAWCKENPGKNPPYLHNPKAKKLRKALLKETGSEILCSKITGQTFETIDDHSEYLIKGGCRKLIDVLAT
jgi:hypothetical protein